MLTIHLDLQLRTDSNANPYFHRKGSPPFCFVLLCHSCLRDTILVLKMTPITKHETFHMTMKISSICGLSFWTLPSRSHRLRFPFSILCLCRHYHCLRLHYCRGFRRIPLAFKDAPLQLHLPTSHHLHSNTHVMVHKPLHLCYVNHPYQDSHSHHSLGPGTPPLKPAET